MRKETGVVALGGYWRTVTCVLSALILMLVSGMGTAYADPGPHPPPPPNPPRAATASDAAKQLDVAQHDAEALIEQWHSAVDSLHDRRDAAQRAYEKAEPARLAALQARRTVMQYQAQIDQLTGQALQAGRLDQLNALVLSSSPEQYLDQMTTLDTYATQQRSQLDHAVAMVAAAERTQRDATALLSHATETALQARAAAQQIVVRKRQADVRIGQAQALLAQLSPAQRAARVRGASPPVGVFLGNNLGAMALKIAMTRFDSPYVWGATGPSNFDCSGLIFWAYKRLGITLPRSSNAQSQVGRPVAYNDLQPGDLVFFYSPVSHVGIYAGDGKVLNAVQTGDVVRYSDLSKMHSYAGARRL
ncbi:MAG TPA: C40 family peptidase [Pseudonocardia sp.]|jgi:cell wall-associated NlpC family hydrolase|nr:C40 family peptidase [Pseudonocardia sp.]